MSAIPSVSTASEVSKISPSVATSAVAAAVKAQPNAATPTPAAPTAAIPLVAAPAAASCCHGASAEATAAHEHLATGAAATKHEHACHGSGNALKSLVKDLESPDASVRLSAANALGQLKNHAAAAPLIAVLSDTDADVAHAAAASLGILGDRTAVEPLIAVVNNADGYFHDTVRAAGALSLGQLHDLRAVEPLQNAIKDPIADTSAEAIRAIAALGDQRGIAPLLEVVRNSDGFFLQMSRHAAILGLAKLGGTQADCELRFVASNQFEDAAIRDAAIGAIGGTAAPVAAN